VRIGTIAAVPEVLRALGADPASVLREAGIDPGLFEDIDTPISHAARGRLIQACVTRTGCQHFGLLVGQRAGLRALGLIGLMVKYSADVGSALGSLVHYFHLHSSGSRTDLAVEGDWATLSYSAWATGVEAAEQIADGAVAVLFSILRELCGPGWSPTEVRFARRRPEDIAPFRRLFGASLRFERERNALVFPSHWLSRPLPQSDPELRHLLQQRIAAVEAEQVGDFATKVRGVLRSALLTDQASAAHVAALFSMHGRTLHRRLHACGTGFRELADETGFAIARRALEDTSMDVSQVAGMLGYADASSFTRAFRRWSGTTPAAWRAQCGSRPRRRP
jgi:AraC-like DNA-binding protein